METNRFPVLGNNQAQRISPMHIKMHYTPTTTDLTAFHNPSLYTTNKHIAYFKWQQNGTRCRDGVKVLWCH